jgi:AcrR family transcriptional regulator
MESTEGRGESPSPPRGTNAKGGTDTDQRQRLTRAMIAVVADKGYAAATVADVIERARVSRATFYELFSGKEDCFLASYQEMVGTVTAQVASAFDAADEASWPERVTVGLATLLRVLADNPDAARVAIVEVIGGGPRAHELAIQSASAFLPFLETGVRLVEGELPPHVPRAVIGGGAMLIVEEIKAGRTAELPELLPELVYVVLVPFLGHRAAHKALIEARGMPGASARQPGIAAPESMD